MAYNYLEITNSLLRSLNEVELTSNNFVAAKGFYAHAKDAVNNALRDINQAGQDWPFNHVEQTDTLSDGVSRYAFPSDASKIDFDSFRIKEDITFGNDTVRLEVITYDDYLKYYIDQEYSTDTSRLGVPTKVCHAPSDQYVVIPPPKEDYELVYEYYRIPVDLVNPTDVPFVPERYKYVVLDGAKYHAYMFRSNEQAASIAKGKFEEGLKRMRTILINRYEYITSTYRPTGTMLISGSRIA